MAPKLPVTVFLDVARYLDVQTQYLFLLAYPELAHLFTFRHTSQTDEKGNTVINLLINYGNAGILKALLLQSQDGCDDQTNDASRLHKTRIDLNQLNTNRYGPLHLAVSSGYLGIVKILLCQPDIAVDQPASPHPPPLAMAAKQGHASMVRVILENHKVSSESQDLALWWAAAKGHREIVKLLLGQDGINIRTTGRSRAGWTAIHKAVYGGHGEVVELLLDRDDTAVNVRNTYGVTPLHVAVSRCHIPMVKLLLERPKVNVNVVSGLETPLTIAIRKGHMKIVQLLLGGYDANPKLRKRFWGFGPLLIASLCGNLAMVKLLAERPDIRRSFKHRDDIYFSLVLRVSVRHGYFDIVKFLLEQDDINLKTEDKEGHTVLTAAAEAGIEEMVKLLLQRADEMLGEDGYLAGQPLIAAIRRRNVEVVKLLLEHPNINLEEKDRRSNTPMSLALVKGDEAILTMLHEKMKPRP